MSHHIFSIPPSNVSPINLPGSAGRQLSPAEPGRFIGLTLEGGIENMW
jgi:hypothetical protein